MTVIMDSVRDTLEEAGYAVLSDPAGSPNEAAFESKTILGVVLCFDSVAALIEQWESRLSTVISHHQFALRRSGAKAWNAYAVLLTEEEADEHIRPVLNSIEENLIGIRKIVRSGAAGAGTKRALLPLLPFLRSPELPRVDMAEEIRFRTGGIPNEALRAFFSDASEAVTLQVIEES